MSISLDELESKKCPICNSDMELKLGKYGYFFGCKNFRKNKCKGTIDVPKIPYELEYIDYDGFIANNPTEYLLTLIENNDLPKHVKYLREELNNKPIIKGTISEENIKGKISGVIDYLNKKGMYFEISKLVYWFYTLDGELDGKFDYWINRRLNGDFRDESFIKKAIVDYWSHIPLAQYSYYASEFEIGKCIGESSGYRVDIVAKDNFEDRLIFIEVKGPKQKAKVAMPQIINYTRVYNRYNKARNIEKSYIISKGYPREVFDDDLSFEIGLIGYVIEGDKISFIPWKVI